MVRQFKNHTAVLKNILINNISDAIIERLIVDLCPAIIMYARLIK